MMATVFPTPAPPKSQTFQPFRIGAKRSMTFIPVTRISCLVERLMKAGALR